MVSKYFIGTNVDKWPVKAAYQMLEQDNPLFTMRQLLTALKLREIHQCSIEVPQMQRDLSECRIF